jgi:hypothetical protein
MSNVLARAKIWSQKHGLVQANAIGAEKSTIARSK